ncbi:Uncharacterised protein [Capnocytophaga ochracea]|uniref:Uncharacterized protein n=1 Tax=Capnocytophaga ochracea TaxID=1018 RepID=A0A2X2SU40_CAPOC|nr:Uncharacterised protein [Capnocytophaga ochracea]
MKKNLNTTSTPYNSLFPLLGRGEQERKVKHHIAFAARPLSLGEGERG